MLNDDTLASDDPLRFRKNLFNIYWNHDNDQIRDEKLQYDINRKVTEISALSSGKSDKYEYLTGKEILLSNQQQVIEQGKFTYSPLGKAFEKQKTIEDQGERHVEVLKKLKDHNKQLANDYGDKLLISKEREIFKSIYNKRHGKIKKLSKKIDNNLVFTTLSTGRKTDFSQKDDALTFLDKIKKR